jgi:hypothetical protein
MDGRRRWSQDRRSQNPAYRSTRPSPSRSRRSLACWPGYPAGGRWSSLVTVRRPGDALTPAEVPSHAPARTRFTGRARPPAVAPRWPPPECQSAPRCRGPGCRPAVTILASRRAVIGGDESNAARPHRGVRGFHAEPRLHIGKTLRPRQLPAMEGGQARIGTSGCPRWPDPQAGRCRFLTYEPPRSEWGFEPHTPRGVRKRSAPCAWGVLGQAQC